KNSSADGGELIAPGPRNAAAAVPAGVASHVDVSMANPCTFASRLFSPLAKDGIVAPAMPTARLPIHHRRDSSGTPRFPPSGSGRTYYKKEFAEPFNWQALNLQIEDRRFTPVLGPGLADSILGSRQDVARRWVKRWQMPLTAHSQGDLAQVAQYLSVRAKIGT